MTLGIPAADPRSQISTTDGLYLLEGMEATSRGEAVMLEMDVERGGFVDVKVLMSSYILGVKKLISFSKFSAPTIAFLAI